MRVACPDSNSKRDAARVADRGRCASPSFRRRSVLRAKKKFLGVNSMLAKKPKTKLLVDGGDPGETLRIKKLIGFVDGQTTNPSLIAKNPEIQRLIASGHKLTSQEDRDEYKKIVQSISPLVGDAGVTLRLLSWRRSIRAVD